MRLVNLTGHDLVICGMLVPGTNQRATLDSMMREVKRMSTFNTEFGHTDIPLLEVTERGILNLPAPQKDVLYIVSGIVASAAQREDVVAPARMIRDSKGKVTQCRALVRPRPLTRKANDGEA